MLGALELFARHDFSAVTIKDIAKASDMNAALIYYYYESKEDLFRASIEFAIKTALARSNELREKHSDPVFLIKEWFRNNYEGAELIKQLVKVMLDYTGSGQAMPSVDKLITEFYAVEEDAILARAIQSGIAMRIFKEVDSVKIARFVSVHLDGIMVASIMRPSVNIKTSLSELQKVLWSYLDYSDPEHAKVTPKRHTRPRK